MCEKMDQMQSEFNRFFQLLRDYMANQTAIEHDPQATQALVPTRRTVVVRASNRRNIKIEEAEDSAG